MSEMFRELLSSNPYAIIELFELHLDLDLHGSAEIVRFHSGVNQKTPAGDIYWQGEPYQPLPIEADGFEYNGNGQLPRPRIRISNLLGSISALLLGVNEITPGNDLTGAKLIRIRTLSRFLDPVNFTGGTNPYGTPANEEMPREVYYIDRKSVENREIVEFELAAVFDLAGVRAPKRQVIANICQWKYRSAECGYTGANYFDEYDNPLGATPAVNFAASAFGNQLTAGETLSNGDYITSANGWYKGIMQNDGNFVVYKKPGPQGIPGNNAVWATNTVRGSGSYQLRMQTDGNVVLYKDGSEVLWASNTASTASPATSGPSGRATMPSPPLPTTRAGTPPIRFPSAPSPPATSTAMATSTLPTAARATGPACPSTAATASPTPPPYSMPTSSVAISICILTSPTSSTTL
ncbi:phage minor tail protein L [bacterium]|nr:phage minor tail protein L [bacterium]